MWSTGPGIMLAQIGCFENHMVSRRDLNPSPIADPVPGVIARVVEYFTVDVGRHDERASLEIPLQLQPVAIACRECLPANKSHLAAVSVTYHQLPRQKVSGSHFHQPSTLQGR